MCGIAGELRFKDVPTQADWDKIRAMMRRRGPDDGGGWESDRCTLVFQRLAIIDLSPAGHQPMNVSDGRYTLVFNGEVYNFAELREELRKRGVCFQSHSDTEVVLYALIEWGVKALEMFNGMFALGFYDAHERYLLLARDHAGIKPLYYLRSPEGVVFASQYDQILAHPWSHQQKVSQQALGLYLRLAHIPAPFALLENSHMLEPGAWMEFGANGSVRHGRFFQFPRYERPTLAGAEAREAVDAAVSSAVKRQLVSDVPVATFLSGGIDSPLVAAKMRAYTSGDMEAFTIGTGGDAMDESADAAIYARQLGIKHTLEQVSAEQALSMLDQVVAACGEPFGDYSIFPTMLVSRLAGSKYKVILSGDGGDELFWGYARRFGKLLEVARDFRHPYWLRSARWGAKKLFGIGNGHYNLRRPSLGDWYREVHQHLPEDNLSHIFPALPAWPSAYQDFAYSGWKTDETAQWLRWNEFTSHLTMVLQKVDRASMHNSLEVRVPLLDREVISVASRIDWQTCLDLETMTGKLPLRNSLSRHIQHQTVAKRGFAVPMGEWLRTSLRPVVEETLLGQDEILGLEINKQALSGLYKKHLHGQTDLAWGLWPLLSLALWSRHHFAGR